MTTTKITPQELLEKLNSELSKTARPYCFLTKDSISYCAWTHKPILKNDFTSDGFAGMNYIGLEGYCRMHLLEVVGLEMNKIYEFKELTKITPSEILELMNAEIREINLENGDDEDENLVNYVTMDSEGIYCWCEQPYFDYDNGEKKFKPHWGCEGLEFDTTKYEVVGINLNQMFADYSI